MKQIPLREHMYHAPNDKHNERDPETIAKENVAAEQGLKTRWIDPQGVHEVLGPGQTLMEGFTTVFGDSIDDYNAHQTRADRKMTVSGYLDSVENDRRGRPVKSIKNANKKAIAQGQEDAVRKESGQRTHYEMLVSIGNVKPLRDPDTGKVVIDPKTGLRVRPDYVDADINLKILKDYLDGWAVRNPNFYLFRADFHADEWYKVVKGGLDIEGLPGKWMPGESHGHVGFIAWAEGYKRGPKRQVSVTKALAAMGYVDKYDADGRRVTAWEQWEADEREVLTEIARNYGYEIVPADDSREALAADEYAELQDARDELAEVQARTAGLIAREDAVRDQEIKLDEWASELGRREAAVTAREQAQDEQRERLKQATDLFNKQKQDAADLDERLPRLRKQAKAEEEKAAKAVQTAEEASQRAVQWSERFKVLEREEQAIQDRIAALRDKEDDAYRAAWNDGANSDFGRMNAINRARERKEEDEATRQDKQRKAREDGIGLP